MKFEGLIIFDRFIVFYLNFVKMVLDLGSIYFVLGFGEGFSFISCEF